MGAVSFIDRTLVLGVTLGVRMGAPAGGMANGVGGEGWVCGTGVRSAGVAGGQRGERVLCRSSEEQWADTQPRLGREGRRTTLSRDAEGLCVIYCIPGSR